MAISFPLDLPLQDIAEFEVTSKNSSTLQASPFTGRVRVQEYIGDWWEVTFRYRNLNRELAQEVIGFMDALRGPVGTFLAEFPGYRQSRGTAALIASSPSVNGSGQAGKPELVVQSAPSSQSGWLLAGDIIQVGPSSRAHWHRVTQDVDTDASGNATIDLWPYVREGTIGGDPVGLTSPRCLFRLTDSTSVSLSSPVIHDFDIVAREAI